MPSNPWAKVIETPFTPSGTTDRWSLIGEQLGHGLLQGYAGQESAKIEEAERQRKLDEELAKNKATSEPVRQALFAQLGGLTARTPVQEALFQQVSDENADNFARLMASPTGGGKAFVDMATEAAKPTPGVPEIRIITSDSEEGKRLGVPAGMVLPLEETRDSTGTITARKRGNLTKLPDADGTSGSGSGPDSLFGNSLDGISMAYFTQLAEKMQAGTYTPEEARVWEASVTNYTQPRTSLDPVTQEPIVITPPLPDFAKRANDAYLGRNYGGGQPGAPVGPGEDEIILAESIPASPGPGPDDSVLVLNRGGDVSGVKPFIGNLLRASPFGALNNNPKLKAARAAAKSLSIQGGKIIRANPRFAESERQEREADLNLDPRLYDNAIAYEENVLAWLDNFRIMQREAERELAEATEEDGRPLTRERRQRNLDLIKEVDAFRRIAGPAFFDEREVEEANLPPGSRVWVRGPTGWRSGVIE